MTLDRMPFRVAQALLLFVAVGGTLLYGYVAVLLLRLTPRNAVAVTFALTAACMFFALACIVLQGYFRWRGRTF